MRTPVSAARQCLTEEAARALDEAVAVARRRGHAQTTSVHAVSALLALPSSMLRDACARARSSAYSSRLQFRALDLCVGVSLDRLPSSKTAEEPPVSNSLMAAIKRSQAKQRRHPESYHLQQLHNNSGSSAATQLKVELKYFILSILDDPIVSRIFDEAGFSRWDIRQAFVHPPMAQVSSRFSRTRCPPIFLCNLTDSEPCSTLGRSGLSFPFSTQEDGVDGNHRRICEVLIRKSGKNPFLIGVCAGDALKNFMESLERGKLGFLPVELSGLKVFSIDKEIIEFVGDGGSEKKLGTKLKELGHLVENVVGAGVLVNLGDLKELVAESVAADAVSSLVSKLTCLLEIHGGKLWLIGAAATSDLYSKLLTRFPSVDKDWDLQLLPVTSSGSLCFSKSSLMGSFVPFGGFFSTPLDFKIPFSNMSQPVSRCQLGDEKYEQEVAANLSVGSAASVADQYSENLPPWLRMAAVDMSKEGEGTKTKNDATQSNARVSVLQKKWNDICQSLHHPQPIPKVDEPQSRSQGQIPERRQIFRDKKHSTEADTFMNESRYANQFDGVQKLHLPKYGITTPMASKVENSISASRMPVEFPKAWQIHKESSSNSPSTQLSPSPRTRCTSSSSVLPLTTDLRLGAIDVVTSQEPVTSKLQGDKECLQHFSGSISGELDADSENVSRQVAQSSACSGLKSGEQMDRRDYKFIRQGLSEKVGWQDESVAAISQAVSRYRTGYGRCHGSSRNTGLWLTFVGPDRIGKRRVASALAEILFGSKENSLFIDFRMQEESSQSNLMFECQALNIYDDNFRGKTVIDLISGELKKKPNSVIFLENVDKADFQVQSSLSHGFRTGKFPDSYGREISISNTVFIASPVTKGNFASLSEMKSMNFSEDRVLRAKNRQMEILVDHVSEDARKGSNMQVKIAGMEETSNSGHSNKRKLIGISDPRELSRSSTNVQAHKVPRSCLDLNLPVVETEADISHDDSASDSISENSETWLGEFLGEIDKNIYFKPLNFDELAEKVVRQIRLQFETIVGCEALLEIDQEVMVQILAAMLLSNMKGTVQDWLERVLGGSLAEARQKHNPNSRSILRLVACEGILVEEDVSGVCLPAKIIVN